MGARGRVCVRGADRPTATRRLGREWAAGARASAGGLPRSLVGERLPTRGRVCAGRFVAGQLPAPALGGACRRAAPRAEAVAGIPHFVRLVWPPLVPSSPQGATLRGQWTSWF